ncbi:MAG: sensor histidine kinase [Actinomycetota bacterium]
MSDDHSFAELIAKIGHELRSPLTSVRGFSSTLVQRWERFDDAQKRGFVHTIHQEAERMTRIVSEVLDLARVTSGDLQLQRGPVEVATVAAAARARLGGLSGAERVRLDVPEDLLVDADRNRLEQMLFLLLENAVRFSDAGAVTLTAAKGPDATTEIAVKDAGPGIEQARLETLFSGPNESPTKASPRGSGLGLLLCRQLAEAHGGSIGVTSGPGVGSTFRIRLPAPEQA